MSVPNLTGQRYLIVEDEYLVAWDLCTSLEDAGATVFGPVSDVERAIEILSQPGFGLDAAVLDINLQGEMIFPAAEVLKRRGIPFVFVSGNTNATVPSEFSHAPRLTKPYNKDVLIAQLLDLSSPSRTPNERMQRDSSSDYPPQ